MAGRTIETLWGRMPVPAPTRDDEALWRVEIQHGTGKGSSIHLEPFDERGKGGEAKACEGSLNHGDHAWGVGEECPATCQTCGVDVRDLRDERSATRPRPCARLSLDALEHAAAFYGKRLRDVRSALRVTVADVAGGRATGKAIAEHWGIKATTASNRLRRAEEAGYLASEEVLGVRTFRLTPLGEALESGLEPEEDGAR